MINIDDYKTFRTTTINKSIVITMITRQLYMNDSIRRLIDSGISTKPDVVDICIKNIGIFNSCILYGTARSRDEYEMTFYYDRYKPLTFVDGWVEKRKNAKISV